MLVETDDAALLVELQRDPRTGPLFVMQLAPCAALVRPAALPLFLDRLVKAGHTPRVSEL